MIIHSFMKKPGFLNGSNLQPKNSHTQSLLEFYSPWFYSSGLFLPSFVCLEEIWKEGRKESFVHLDHLIHTQHLTLIKMQRISNDHDDDVKWWMDSMDYAWLAPKSFGLDELGWVEGEGGKGGSLKKHINLFWFKCFTCRSLTLWSCHVVHLELLPREVSLQILCFLGKVSTSNSLASVLPHWLDWGSKFWQWCKGHFFEGKKWAQVGLVVVHIMKIFFSFFLEVVIFRELISTCCQNILGRTLKVSLLSSLTCSQNWAK